MSETTGPFESGTDQDLSIHVSEATLERGQVIDHYRLMHRLGVAGKVKSGWLSNMSRCVVKLPSNS